MSQQGLPDELKNMLLNDELKEVIDRLRAHLPELRGQVTEEELLQYAARLNAVEREWKLGIITAERYGIEKNQLRQILIQTVTQLRKAADAPVPKPAPSPDGPERLLGKGSQQHQDGEYQQAIAKASLGFFDEADTLLRQAVMKGCRNAKNARQMIDNLRAL